MADERGPLVWGEMPSAYRFTPRAARRLTEEWLAVVGGELVGVHDYDQDPERLRARLGLPLDDLLARERPNARRLLLDAEGRAGTARRKRRSRSSRRDAGRGSS